MYRSCERLLQLGKADSRRAIGSIVRERGDDACEDHVRSSVSKAARLDSLFKKTSPTMARFSPLAPVNDMPTIPPVHMPETDEAPRLKSFGLIWKACEIPEKVRATSGVELHGYW